MPPLPRRRCSRPYYGRCSPWVHRTRFAPPPLRPVKQPRPPQTAGQPHLRVTPVRGGAQRQAGVGLARPRRRRVHAANLRSPNGRGGRRRRVHGRRRAGRWQWGGNTTPADSRKPRPGRDRGNSRLAGENRTAADSGDLPRRIIIRVSQVRVLSPASHRHAGNG